jgi:peptidoglycan/LPS O-acetylase OafA/YrhL
MNEQQSSFSDSLASLRGIAATIVVIYHSQLMFRVGDLDNPHRIGFSLDDPLQVLVLSILSLLNGSSAVILFFVLSGTVLAMSLHRAGPMRSADWMAYYLRRAFRLMPLLFAITLMSAAMHTFFFENIKFSTTTTWMGNYYTHNPTLSEIVLNAIGVSNSLNSPAWTIRIEIAASIVFPVLYLLGRRWPLIALTSIALIVLMFLELPLYYVHVYLLAFFLGSLIPTHGGGLIVSYMKLPRLLRIAAVVGALILMACFERAHRHWVHVDPLSVLVVTICAAFLVAIVLHRPDARWLRSRFLVRIGDLSYGLYLIHFVVLFALAHLIAPHFEASGLTAIQALGLNAALAIATLMLTLPAAAITYSLLEKPLQQYGRRLAYTLYGGGRRPLDAQVRGVLG